MDNIIVDRCYCIYDLKDPIIRTELHGFSDASEVAYGACVYIRFIMLSGDIKVSFVSAKSRVALIKNKQTVQRLQLMGNLVLCRLICSLTTVVKTFLQKCVFEIRSKIQPNKWFYCRSNQNPADLITRVNIENLLTIFR